jgi:acyl carrier protein
MTVEQAYSLIQDSVHTLAKAGLLPATLSQYQVTPTMRMDGLPIDSVGKTSLINEIEARGRLRLPLSELSDIETLEDLAGMMAHSQRAE